MRMTSLKNIVFVYTLWMYKYFWKRTAIVQNLNKLLILSLINWI